MKHIAIFASGTGSNAAKIMAYFQGHASIRVCLLLSNKADAPVLDTARSFGVATAVIDRHSFYETDQVLDVLAEHRTDLIALAGFLWLVPPRLVAAFPSRILNIHPALLPKYGGKGMYGMHVHRAVKAAGDDVSGMSIHYVNERYDEGDVVFQASCSLSPEDSAEDIARKVLALEHEHFARVLEEVAMGC